MVGTASHHCGKEVLSVLVSAWKSPISWPFWDSRYDWNPWKTQSLFSDVEGLLQSQLFLGTEIFPFFLKWKGSGKEKRGVPVFSLWGLPPAVGGAPPAWWAKPAPLSHPGTDGAEWAPPGSSGPALCPIAVQECFPSSPRSQAWPATLSSQGQCLLAAASESPQPLLLTSEVVSESRIYLCGAILPPPSLFFF